MSERLVHRLREPAGEPEGALVLNHGRGADENDLFGLLDALDPERRLLGVTTGAPAHGMCRPAGATGTWWSGSAIPIRERSPASYRALTGFLDGLLAERGIGWDRTVIGGFSMGAVMSYAVALGGGPPVAGGGARFQWLRPYGRGLARRRSRVERASRS